MKTCKICLNQFEPVRALMVTCSYSCALAYSRGKIAKVVKAENKVKKEKMKTKSQHLKELQTIFNKYIRTRDFQEPCISCRTISNVKYDAGTEFYNKKIITLIEPYLITLGIKYKKLSKQEISDLLRCNRVRKTLKKINIGSAINFLIDSLIYL